MLDAYAPTTSMDQVPSSFKDFDKKFCIVSSCNAFSFVQEKMYLSPTNNHDEVIQKCNNSGLWHESFAVKQSRFLLDLIEGSPSANDHLFSESREQKENENMEHKKNDLWGFTSPLERKESSFQVAGHIPAYTNTSSDSTSNTMEVESSTISFSASSSDDDSSSWATSISLSNANTVIIEFDEDKLTENACSTPDEDDGSTCESDDQDDGAKFELFDDVSEMTEDENDDDDGVDDDQDHDLHNDTDAHNEDQMSQWEEPAVNKVAKAIEDAHLIQLLLDDVNEDQYHDLHNDTDAHNEDQMSQWEEPAVNKVAKAIEDAHLIQFLLSYCVTSDT